MTWVPTGRVLDTFTAVFPHVLSFGDIALGSETPIRFDAKAIEQRLQDPAVRSHYLRAGIDIDALLAPYLAAPGPRHIDAGPAHHHDLNHDLFPRDEFSVPRTKGRNTCYVLRVLRCNVLKTCHVLRACATCHVPACCVQRRDRASRTLARDT